MRAKKRTWPAAVTGLVALAVLAGCVSEPNVAPRSAAAIRETQETGQMPDESGHEHGHGATASPEAVPAGPEAVPAGPEAIPAGQPAKTLSPDPLDSPADTSVMDAQRSAEMAEAMAGGGGHDSHAGHGGHGGHGATGATGTYRHVDAGREPAGPAADEGAEPHHHQGTEETAAVVYACPMHPEVTSNEPGTCSKCGMALVERREE